MAASFLRYLLPLLLVLYAVRGNRENECIEVGFARAAGSNLHNGYEAAKDAVLARWAEEDTEGRPDYAGLSPLLKNVTRTGQLLEAASQVIVDLIRKTRVGKRCRGAWLLSGLEKHVIPLINLDKDLAEDLGLVMSFRCMVGSPYPNVDGSCVNQESPDLGSIGSKFLRLQPAVSGSDGFSPRGSVNGEKTLPSARQVAQLLRKYLKKPAVTGLFSEWSHFIQRDTFSIPESPQAQDVDCCLSPEAEDCAPIPVEEDDPMSSAVPCINFRRSARAQAILGHRESLSLVSTYLDATPVYGPSDKVAFERKAGYFGYLKTPELVEKAEEGNDVKSGKEVKCGAPESLEGCFQMAQGEDWAEDLRLLLALEHNRLVDALSEINPHFDDSLLYNEARRMVIAGYDHITYGEYLPVLMGEAAVKKHSLGPGAEGPAAKFIPEVNPGILTNFALASYRNPSMHTEWKEAWGRTDIMESTHYDSIRDDSYQDLLAMDVQRGRDHGLAGYKVWSSFCNNGHSNSWEDLEQNFSKELVQELKRLYHDEVEDVDAQLALLEKPDDGGVIGKTYTCILADQFARLKTGNRLYWEHESSLLTVEQKDFLKESTLARLLCHNLPLHAVPTNAFLPPSDSNPLVPCSQLPVGDISPWKDTSLIEKMKQIKEGKASEQKEEASEQQQQEEASEQQEEVNEQQEEASQAKETSKHSEL
ncbi:peroxidase-like [Homarus americanus]|uniref:peroxidase-like n=1 Tax=Homarus americanus TaxID=6706 RepID=UPI001C485AF8|nr:peroxidase-like [Homarus americanus]